MSASLDQKPLVSIILPCHNAADYLALTLRSALSQHHVHFELVAVDDASTDTSTAILEGAARLDPRVRVVRQPRQMGVAEARNRAIAEARGNLIAPLDADDLWHPTFLSRQVARLTAGGPDIPLSYCWFLIIDGSGRCLRRSRPWRLKARAEVENALRHGNFIGNASSVLMRRAAVEAAGGYDTSLRARHAEGCEDLKLYALLARRGDFCVVEDHLVGYRRHGAAMSAKRLQMARSFEAVARDLWPSPSGGTPREVRAAIARWYYSAAKKSFVTGSWRDLMASAHGWLRHADSRSCRDTTNDSVRRYLVSRIVGNGEDHLEPCVEWLAELAAE